MKATKYGEIIYSGDEIFEGLYSGNLKSLADIFCSDELLINQFNDSIEINADKIDKIPTYIENNLSIEEYDSLRQSEWLIPTDYKSFNITQWLLEQCNTEIERDRVLDELELFIQHNMIDVLICLKYLVDHMRKNNIVWGLGRGSSTSSYCLFLIGVHKIDSIKYSLDIKEFLKGE